MIDKSVLNLVDLYKVKNINCKKLKCFNYAQK